MQELESILQERDENGLSLDGSLLFYSGAMAPLNFKPASASSNKLGSGSLLDYVSELLKPYSVSSSSIKPIIFDRDEIDLVCKAAKEWSKEFSVPSLPIAPKVEMDYGAKAWEDAIYKLNLSAPSSPLRPGNKPSSHDWSPQNNVLSGFYSPSSPINPFKIKANPWKEEKPSFGMPGFEPLRFKMPEAGLSPLFKLSEREKPFGLIDPQPFQIGYDFPATKIQLHLHGPDTNHLTYGKIKSYDGALLGEIKDSYNLAMTDLHAERLGFKKRTLSNKRGGI